jgi:hypothetical protein
VRSALVYHNSERRYRGVGAAAHYAAPILPPQSSNRQGRYCPTPLLSGAGPAVLGFGVGLTARYAAHDIVRERWALWCTAAFLRQWYWPLLGLAIIAEMPNREGAVML